MSDDQINQAIAEACGWKPQTICRDMAGNLFPDSVPLYTTDLNAMHEAEQMLTNEQFDIYFCELEDQMPFAKPQTKRRHTCGAKARQRAEAFLRTLGKWR